MANRVKEFVKADKFLRGVPSRGANMRWWLNLKLDVEWVIPRGAAFQSERVTPFQREHRGGRSLDPLEKTRVFGMTPSLQISN